MFSLMSIWSLLFYLYTKVKDFSGLLLSEATFENPLFWTNYSKKKSSILNSSLVACNFMCIALRANYVEWRLLAGETLHRI